MKIDIYRSATNSTKYLSVPSGADVGNLVLPANIDSDLLKLSPFKTPLEIRPEQPRIALDAADVINQINKNGYAIHGTTTTIDVKTTRQP